MLNILDASREIADQGEKMIFLALAWLGVSAATLGDVTTSPHEPLLDRIVNYGALGAVLGFLLWFVIRPAILRLVTSTERLHERLGTTQERILERQVEQSHRLASIDERLDAVEREGCAVARRSKISS